MEATKNAIEPEKQMSVGKPGVMAHFSILPAMLSRFQQSNKLFD